MLKLDVVVIQYDKYHPNANYHWSLIFEGRRGQAQIRDDIMMEEITLMLPACRSGKKCDF